MLAGLIRDDERRVLEGVPGLIDIPVVGRLFAHNLKETTQTDIILTLTPHIIRVLDLNEADLRAFRVGRDSLAPLTELPLPFELPRPPDGTPPQAPVAAPPATTPPATTPPATTPTAPIPPPSSRLPGDFN
jgi:general secretion pathway protein D